MPVWMTTTGIHGSIQVLSEERVPLKGGKEKWLPGLRLPLQRAWVTLEVTPSDGTSIPMDPKMEFSRVSPEYIDTDHLPAGVLIDLKKVCRVRDDWRGGDPVKKLEAWLDGDEAQQYYQMERGDPRGKRPVRMMMTADDYAKFQVTKAKGDLDVSEVVTTPPDAGGAQKVVQGTRTTR